MQKIDISMLDEISKLFVDVFNSSPWNDSWNVNQAKERLLDIMNTPKYIGMVEYQENRIVGLIMGRGEQYFDGTHFQILEFCIDKSVQGKGIGSRMLNDFLKYLKSQNIDKCFLLTCHGEKTEGFYCKNGFKTNVSMCLMDIKLLHKGGYFFEQ